MGESTLITALIIIVIAVFDLWLIERAMCSKSTSTSPEYLDEETARWLNEGQG